MAVVTLDFYVDAVKDYSYADYDAYVVRLYVVHPDYRNFGTSGNQGFRIGETEDVPNLIFESKQDGLDYLKNWYFNQFVDSLSYMPRVVDTFLEGGYVDIPNPYLDIINSLESRVTALENP